VNDLWCADYKGEFMLGDKRYCYPLTITDYASRYLLCYEALSTTREDFAFETFTRIFKEHGLPKSIRTDNGIPFASGNSLYGLTKLSVWWLRLGITLERIKPGHPEQNGMDLLGPYFPGPLASKRALPAKISNFVHRTVVNALSFGKNAVSFC